MCLSAIFSSVFNSLANCRLGGVNCRGYSQAHSPVHGRQGAHHISCQEPSPGQLIISLLHPLLRMRLQAMTDCFPVGASSNSAQINSSDSTVCFSDEQMYRAARLGAGRRGKRALVCSLHPLLNSFFLSFFLVTFLIILHVNAV